MEAEPRQGKRGCSRTTADVERAPWPGHLRDGKKILQVGEHQIGAPSTFGRLEVGGIGLCAVPEALVALAIVICLRKMIVRDYYTAHHRIEPSVLTQGVQTGSGPDFRGE